VRNPAKEARLLREVQKAQLSAVSRVRGLFLQPEDPGFNPDALVNWQECSTRTRAAIILTNGVLANERAKQQALTPKVFGVVMIQARVEDHGQWEQMAADVRDGKAIEAVPVEAKEESA
jgi:hypothetical protein